VDEFVSEKFTNSFIFILGLEFDTVTGNLWKAGNILFLVMPLTWLDRYLICIESIQGI
jgi:hypothetical protein